MSKTIDAKHIVMPRKIAIRLFGNEKLEDWKLASTKKGRVNK